MSHSINVSQRKQILPHSKCLTKCGTTDTEIYFIPWPRHILAEKGCAEMCNFCMAASMFETSWDKNKNPYPCRDRTYPNSVQHENLEITQPTASCFPGPDDAPCCEMCDFHTGMGSCYITVGRKDSSSSIYVWGIFINVVPLCKEHHHLSPAASISLQNRWACCLILNWFTLSAVQAKE